MINLLAKTINAPFNYNDISMQSIAGNFDGSSDKNILFRSLEYGIDKSIKTQNFY